jgi:hypothetical protein
MYLILVLLIVFLLFGGYGYRSGYTWGGPGGFGYYGGGGLGLIVVVVIVLLLLGRL